MDGDHFFDLLAEDVVFDFVITVPDYPRHVVGRDNLIELYRGSGSTFFLVPRSRPPHPPVRHDLLGGPRVRLRRQGGGHRYSNNYVSVTLEAHKGVALARLLDPLSVLAALEGR